MLLSPGVYRRLPRRGLWSLNLRVPVEVGGRTLTIPVLGALGEQLIHVNPTWKSAAIRALTPLRPGAFVDVGVNIGQTLMDMLAAGIDRPYFGFEPNTRCVSYVQFLIELNHLARCEVFPVALGARAELARLYSDNGVGGHHHEAATLLQDFRPGRENVFSECVSVYRFDDIRDVAGIDQVSLMKIDAEGAELEVLQGMRETLTRLRPLIVCEVLLADRNADLARQNARKQEMVELLASCGYGVAHLTKTPGDAYLTGAEAVTGFPTEDRWSPDRWHDCDYLFYPTEDGARAIDAIQREAARSH